jgi:excisionase family DNA binding protein
MEVTVQSPYLTYDEAVCYTRCDRTTIWRASKAGRLRASGPAGTRRVLFSKSDLDAWMDSRNRQ